LKAQNSHPADDEIGIWAVQETQEIASTHAGTGTGKQRGRAVDFALTAGTVHSSNRALNTTLTHITT
jgi:D-alanyl-D-alanine dipeptidase